MMDETKRNPFINRKDHKDVSNKEDIVDDDVSYQTKKKKESRKEAYDS
ncbi:hypothetical protein Hdeb2414_s0018g00521451 [Helianthus debilis subsp. tardiflorus]